MPVSARSTTRGHYKAVLRGIIPIGRDDEGLKPVAAAADLATTYSNFDQATGEYEIRWAKDYFTVG